MSILDSAVESAWIAGKKVNMTNLEKQAASALIISVPVLTSHLSSYYLTQKQGMLIEQRKKLVDKDAATIFRAFSGLGGERGWSPFNWLWRLRGLLDRLVGGVGMRRGRRHPDDLRQGEALDFWRVGKVEPNYLLRLRAEMKLPGSGWLQFEAHPQENGRTELVQTAYFAFKGLFGLLYWYGIYPLHGIIFSHMIDAIAHRAQNLSQRTIKSTKEKL